MLSTSNMIFADPDDPDEAPTISPTEQNKRDIHGTVKPLVTHYSNKPQRQRNTSLASSLDLSRRRRAVQELEAEDTVNAQAAFDNVRLSAGGASKKSLVVSHKNSYSSSSNSQRPRAEECEDSDHGSNHESQTSSKEKFERQQKSISKYQTPNFEDRQKQLEAACESRNHQLKQPAAASSSSSLVDAQKQGSVTSKASNQQDSITAQSANAENVEYSDSDYNDRGSDHDDDDFVGPIHDYHEEAGYISNNSDEDVQSDVSMEEPNYWDRVPDTFLRGFLEANWVQPPIEMEWWNGVVGGLANVEPVKHDLVIGRYGSHPYEPLSYIPKSDKYFQLNEVQLRNLIHKRNELDGYVSFPIRNGVGRDALVRLLEDQDGQLGRAFGFKKHYGYFYQPDMPEPEDATGMFKMSPENAEDITITFSKQMVHSDMSVVDQALVKRYAPGVDTMYASGNSLLMATPPAMLSLRDFVDYGAVPRSPDYEPLYGLRALATSLHTARVRSHLREGWDYEQVSTITPDMMRAVLFGNTGSVPTEAFKAYIEKTLIRIPDVFLRHNLTERSFLDSHAIDYAPTVYQMMAVVDLLFETQLLDRPYSLGIIIQGQPLPNIDADFSIPSTALIIGDHANTIVWICLGREERLYWIYPMHWTGFGYYPDSDDLSIGQIRVKNWGMTKIPIQDDIVHGKELRLNLDQSYDDPAKAVEDFINGRKCDACRGDDAKPCIGRPCTYCEEHGQLCGPLRREKLISGSFKPGYTDDPADNSKSHGRSKVRTEKKRTEKKSIEKKSNNKLIERRKARGLSVKCDPWDEKFLYGSWEFHDQRLRGPDRWTAEPAPASPYYLVVTCGRVNGKLPNAEKLRDKIHNSSPEFARAHERLLLTGLRDDYAHLLPTAERPGGARSIRRNMYLSFVDKPGMIGISGLEGGYQLEDKSAKCFADLIDEILTPGNNNLPLEINFLIRGFNGLFVGFGADGLGVGWGGLVERFFQADFQNKTKLLDRVFITVCIDPEFVDGHRPLSLHYPYQSIGFVGFQGRMYAKYKLTSLVRRAYMAIKHEAICIAEGKNRRFNDFPHNDDYWDDRVRNGVFVDGIRRDNNDILC